ncbi:MAG TPA: tryptophan synthase subunit alpha [Polyangiaceae bacterium]|nr:tryptophan synthase subunit alpha [Polyangiaceae bacterium]HYQ30997.1 tryptophan synthase subunit alpha [Polyangiaceae bacterium]
MLEAYLRQKREQQEILLMTHIVLGYPDFDTSLRLVEAMVESGVELMELQIPFSEPIADGPVILRANQLALSGGSTVGRCFEFASEVARRFPIPFLFMSYYNVLYKHGTRSFVDRMAKADLKGAIVPDLPPEEGQDYLTAMADAALDPIFIYSPNTKPERLASLAGYGRGFVYCVARKGVTGSHTAFADDLSVYLARARAATPLPLAVGFGVQERADVDFLRGKADIAVVGSETLRILDRSGLAGVRPFLKSLR